MTNKEVELMIEDLNKKILSYKDRIENNLDKSYVEGHNEAIEKMIDRLENIQNESLY